MMFLKKRYLLIIIAALLAWLIFDEKPKPAANKVLSHSQTAEVVKTRSTATTTTQVYKQQVIENTSETRSTVITSSSRTPPVYRVKVVFPQQHFFDDNLCNLNRVRRTLKPDLESAIERLSEEYQHHYYEISEEVELNLYAVHNSEYFETEFLQRTQALYQYYVQLLGKSAKRPITLNMVINPTRDEYIEHVTYFSDSLITSLGVHFGAMNLSYVDYQGSDDKALKTAVHETVHALNAHILGRTPSMFNEGMAELFEDMFVNKGLIEIDTSQRSFNQISYPIMEFFDDNQWPFLETKRLYYSSWLWFAFMSSDQEKQAALTHFMREEQKAPCEAFSADESYQIFHEVYDMFEYDFTDWQDSLPSAN